MRRALKIALYFILEIISLVMLFALCPMKGALMTILGFTLYVALGILIVAVLNDEEYEEV